MPPVCRALRSRAHGKGNVCRVPRSKAHGKQYLCRVSWVQAHGKPFSANFFTELIAFKNCFMTFYWMSIENTFPNTLNNSCFTILNKKFYYFMRFKLYKPNRFLCVFNQNWFNKLYCLFLSNCINITCLMIIFKKTLFHVVIA